MVKCSRSSWISGWFTYDVYKCNNFPLGSSKYWSWPPACISVCPYRNFYQSTGQPLDCYLELIEWQSLDNPLTSSGQTSLLAHLLDRGWKGAQDLIFIQELLYQIVNFRPRLNVICECSWPYAHKLGFNHRVVCFTDANAVVEKVRLSLLCEFMIQKLQ